jgi:flagellar motility protein MotE (MotC chaperone)
MKWLAKIRFLPLTIFFATLMLTVKISDIWEGVDSLMTGSINISEAQAQTQDEEQKPAAEAAGSGQPEESSLPQAQGDNQDTQEEGGVSRLITDDPTLLTPAEIDILQQLAVRRDQLDAREREVDMRTGLLKAAEERINKKIAELQTLRTTIDSLIKKFDAQQEAKLKSLVKIYESMKPKKAAEIFKELEMDTLLEVSERMKERKLADIIANMPPEKAREVTVELRQLRELPKIGQ